MEEKDIEQVLALETSAFNRPWHRPAFASELSSTYSDSYVVKTANDLESGTVIAYICTQLVADELSILKIAVSPIWQCRGVGKSLLNFSITEACKKGAKAVFLEVRPSNLTAVRFYQKRGFRIIGKRPNYYPESGEDAFVMTKTLKENDHEH